MSAADQYVHGSWNVHCARCGFQYKGFQLQREWTGHMVCTGFNTNNCWEARHPQDYIRVRPDHGKVPYIRSEPSDVFIEVDYVGSDVGVQE